MRPKTTAPIITVRTIMSYQPSSGDIDLSTDQAAAIAAQMDAEDAGSPPQRQRRKVGATPLFNRWSKMPISYDFDPSVDTMTRAKIRQAIKLWETNTCARWQEDGADSDRLQFYNGPGCSSMVGRVGGKQVRPCVPQLVFAANLNCRARLRLCRHHFT